LNRLIDSLLITHHSWGCELAVVSGDNFRTEQTELTEAFPHLSARSVRETCVRLDD